MNGKLGNVRELKSVPALGATVFLLLFVSMAFFRRRPPTSLYLFLLGHGRGYAYSCSSGSRLPQHPAVTVSCRRHFVLSHFISFSLVRLKSIFSLFLILPSSFLSSPFRRGMPTRGHRPVHQRTYEDINRTNRGRRPLKPESPPCVFRHQHCNLQGRKLLQGLPARKQRDHSNADTRLPQNKSERTTAQTLCQTKK